MSRVYLIHLLVIVSGLLSACATTVSDKPATKELAPMEKPEKNQPYRVVYYDVLKQAEQYTDYSNFKSDGTYAGKDSDGCSWVSYGDIVSPPLSWKDCSDSPQWHSGENRDMKKNGEIWPLKDGNKVSYTFTQVDAQGKSQGKRTRKCKVTGQVNLDIAAGNVDAYKVVCTRTIGDWSTTRKIYLSPGNSDEVKFVRSSSDKGVETNLEFVRIEE